jgi:hypothetical protein
MEFRQCEIWMILHPREDLKGLKKSLSSALQGFQNLVGLNNKFDFSFLEMTRG